MMESVTTVASPAADEHELPGDKAARIVEAMRVQIAARGIAGATFDHVAREAGVSRGLLHYYFGTKERLLIAVVRREGELREAQLADALAAAASADEVLRALAATYEHFLGEGPATPVMFYELITHAQQNAGIAAELAELGRRLRTFLAQELRARDEQGSLTLSATPDLAAEFLLTLADGVTMRRMIEPGRAAAPLIQQATRAARTVFA